jgi:hypothetical protein
MTAHTLHVCSGDCASRSCNYCHGGLEYCTTCKGAEGTLPTECPGVAMTEVQSAEVYAGRLDFCGGRWKAVTEVQQ